MTDTGITITFGAILSAAAVAAAIYGARFRKRRRAEKLRRRGYKDYNRGRPKLVVDADRGSSVLAETGAAR